MRQEKKTKSFGGVGEGTRGVQLSIKKTHQIRGLGFKGGTSFIPGGKEGLEDVRRMAGGTRSNKKNQGFVGRNFFFNVLFEKRHTHTEKMGSKRRHCLKKRWEGGVSRGRVAAYSRGSFRFTDLVTQKEEGKTGGVYCMEQISVRCHQRHGKGGESWE